MAPKPFLGTTFESKTFIHHSLSTDWKMYWELSGQDWPLMPFCMDSLALLGMWFFMIDDWAMNIGGKPNFHLYENLPAFIPITFEFTVLCAAHGMAITYLIRNWTLPGVKARNPHPRTTDDHFAIEIDRSENHGISDEEIKAILKATNPVEIFEK
jgi:hypothetical protein